MIKSKLHNYILFTTGFLVYFPPDFSWRCKLTDLITATSPFMSEQDLARG